MSRKTYLYFTVTQLISLLVLSLLLIASFSSISTAQQKSQSKSILIDNLEIGDVEPSYTDVAMNGLRIAGDWQHLVAAGKYAIPESAIYQSVKGIAELKGKKFSSAFDISKYSGEEISNLVKNTVLLANSTPSNKLSISQNGWSTIPDLYGKIAFDNFAVANLIYQDVIDFSAPVTSYKNGKTVRYFEAKGEFAGSLEAIYSRKTSTAPHLFKKSPVMHRRFIEK